jgi:signal transduction histidine kinase
MASEMRETGINVVGEMQWGTHFCHFYETTLDMLDTLLPYFKAGLENNEFCMWVISNLLTQEKSRDVLRQAVPELDLYLAERSMEILTYDEWYLKEGVFELERVMDGWNEKLDQALARGYNGMRVVGCTAWLQKKDWRDFREYETQLNEAIANRRMIVLCGYPLAASGAADILDVAHIHQLAIARRKGDWEIVETPELKQAKAEIKRLNEELERRVMERTKELKATNDTLSGEISERKRAEEALKATSEQLRALSVSLRSAREEEGSRIARELHDELGSALTSFRWDIEEIEKLYSGAVDQLTAAMLGAKLNSMMRQIDATIDTVRRISSELRPRILDDFGLLAAIEWQAEQFEARTGITCQVDSLVDNIDLNREQVTAIFRIFQEALTNVLRHAQATRVNILIDEVNREFVFELRDNGRGITEAEITGVRSLGLIGMRERAHLIGARIKIEGAEGEGTVLTIRIPRHNDENPDS